MKTVSRRKFLKNSALTMGAVFAGTHLAASEAVLTDSENRQIAALPLKPEFEPVTEDILKHRGPKILTQTLYDFTYIENPFVKENVFFKMPRELTPLPAFEQAKELLPEPIWEGHQSAVDCYWKAWQLAFKNLRQPTPESGFVANYIDTAFNDCIFMWDTAFILMFARYGRRSFDFLRTFDNFYAKQHKDGFMCREIGQKLGDDRFTRFDPTSTGPNVMAWTEWEYFLNYGDQERLGRVFPVLMAYHQWWRMYRTWPDGSYWNSGWGCGMDNQPRLDRSIPQHLYHGHMVWVDTCFQQILSARILKEMANVLGRSKDISDVALEYEHLIQYVNQKLWDDKTSYYYDRLADGTFNGTKSIGSYWALLADAVPVERLDAFIAHLDNEKEFKRPHRVPTLSADHPEYDRNTGGYWRGAVWPPTNYMVLRGLTKVGKDELASEIAMNHLQNIWAVFEKEKTVFENYASEAAKPGDARRDFVGWGGVPPIATFLEYGLGLRPDIPNGTLIWDIRHLEKHGVNRYPFGLNGMLDLSCEARTDQNQKPKIQVASNIPLRLEIRWGTRNKQIMEIKNQEG